MIANTLRVSPRNDKHYFFGFHDLLITNQHGDKVLALEVSDISHPPLPGEMAISGYIIAGENKFVPIKGTMAWNYPQGARQQWLDDNLFIFNDKVGEVWGSHIVDASINKIIQTNSFPIHCYSDLSEEVFFINYSRVYRVGGYGYTGLTDEMANNDIPTDCGIFKGNLKNNTYELFVSISQIAACGELSPVITGYPHYVTHLYLNPSKTRIAFLHRYRISDGGETTRLMSIDVDGTNLRCLAKGSLSHFTWIDDIRIFIWGQKSASISNIRESKLYNNKVVKLGVGLAKEVVKNYLGKSINTINKMSFLIVNDQNQNNINPIALGLLTEDGHPMLCPTHNDCLVTDTYPDVNGERALMIYNHILNKRIDIGKFKMLEVKPDQHAFSVDKVLDGIDERIKKHFSIDLYCFTRSGFHCDLHPRWSFNGEVVYFDSIHEGTRQIYSVNVSNLI